MTHSTGLRSAVCFSALVAGGAAQADVTAAQVWEDWKSQMNVYGEDTLSVGAEEANGDTLVVRDVTFSFSDDLVSTTAEMGDITLTEQGDGSVSITVADSYPIVVTTEDGAVVTLDVTQSGMEMLVSGDEDEMTYTVSADAYGIALRDVVDGDITFTGDASLTARDMTGTYVTSLEGELRQLDYSGEIASVDLVIDVEPPARNGAAGEYIRANATYTGLSFQADMSLPENIDLAESDDIFTKGFAIAGGYEIAGMEFAIDANVEGDQVVGQGSGGAATLDGEINSDVLRYDAQVTDLNVALNLPPSQFPFPIEVSLGEYGVGIEMPVGQSDEAEDFRLSFDFVDLTLNDMLWDIFDAGKVLPRDPATIQLAIAGTAKPLFDLLDPAQEKAIDNADMPFELEALSLENLRIALAGALVTGEGDFTFDNTDTETFAPMPRPEGSATVEMSGLNALMDNLVAMGLVPEDQIMGGRMMLGMFARTTGDDQLETAVEINGEGHVLVNGQRVR
ncbi:DUF2125 domain-containing protein [Loktanella agnita]|uniref:DUF2125 domain-containing protein n=1 Tax=Loktanella agnita TaxID=287097 RepID=UPI003989C7E1